MRNMSVRVSVAAVAMLALLWSMVFASVAHADPAEQIEVFVDGVKVESGFTVKAGQEIKVKYVIKQTAIDAEDVNGDGKVDAGLQVAPPAPVDGNYRGKTSRYFNLSSYDKGYQSLALGETFETTVKASCMMAVGDLEIKADIHRNKDLYTPVKFSLNDEGNACAKTLPEVTIVDPNGTPRTDYAHIKFGDVIQYRGTLPELASLKAVASWVNPMDTIMMKDLGNKAGQTFSIDMPIGCSYKGESSDLPLMTDVRDVAVVDLGSVGQKPAMESDGSGIGGGVAGADSITPYKESLHVGVQFTIDDDYMNCAKGGGVPIDYFGKPLGKDGKPVSDTVQKVDADKKSDPAAKDSAASKNKIVSQTTSKSAKKSDPALANTGAKAADIAWWASMIFAAGAGVYLTRRKFA